ncbi:MAG: UvrD-helicase domain-containing protein [Verrucomicrobiota bacterium]|nr:UvrD-helicase domain-containing protein [Verrucomicrobiota bacterium]
MADLNSSQRDAVKQIHGPVLILAGAGTGKTRTVISRVAHMIDEGISPSHILAVTFTNKAANEMRERISRIVKKDEAKEVTVCTFHSLCVRILRQGIDRIGYKKNFTIYTGSDQVGLIRKLIARKAGKDESLDHGLALSLIGRSKNKDIPVSENKDSLISEVEKAYNAELKSLNALDFDDLLLFAVLLLNEHDDLRSIWREKFQFITVDEFQDTNGQQMKLIQCLVGKEQNICVVGDDDQSIYGWRGAEITNILDFERFFNDPKIIKLEQNYRSTQAILHTANSVICHNAGRREKKLWSENFANENVRVVAMADEDSESQLVVDEILEMTATEKRSYEDFAVLFRTNSQSRLFETKLREYKIPYRVIGGQSFYDRREIKDLIAYLTIIKNPDDDINLLRVINNPPRGIGAASIEIATEQSRGLGTSLSEVLQSEDYQEKLPQRSRSAVKKFVDMLDDYRSPMLSSYSGFGTLFSQFVEEIEFVDYLGRTCKTDAEREQRKFNVADFLESLRDYESSGRKKGLQGFLDDVALQQDREDDDDGSGVNLITLHAAKGLEFPVVYLVGLEEGILPHKRSLEEGTKDEERRLLYVGMTRAMEKLTMSFCSMRVKYGDEVYCERSSFLDEMDPQFVDVFSNEELYAGPVEEDDAMAYFARMKEMIEED